MTAAAAWSSALALAAAQRNEYWQNWQEALRRETQTGRRMTAAEDARDDLQARIEAVLELLDGKTTKLADQLRAILDPPRRSA